MSASDLDSYVFSDASFDPSSKTGVAGLLFCNRRSLEVNDLDVSQVHLKWFSQTTCTRVELQSVLWAFDLIRQGGKKVNIHLFTDSQSIIKLPERRNRLEKNNFKSNKTGRLLSNADLYQEFYDGYAELQPSLTWVKGHRPAKEKQSVDKQFSLVDRTVRAELRAHLESQREL